jgi:hypothetical protein
MLKHPNLHRSATSMQSCNITLSPSSTNILKTCNVCKIKTKYIIEDVWRFDSLQCLLYYLFFLFGQTIFNFHQVGCMSLFMCR